MKTAVIYARYSSDRQTEQSIEGQVRVCNDYAERNGILIVNQYIDRATTGTNDNREEFQKMLKDSDKKQFDFVLVYKLDRFSRNKFEMAMHRKRLKDNGIKILSAMENIPDSPEGILLESLLEGMNQYYSEELSQKTRRGQRETRIKGLHCALEKELLRINKSINNIMNAIEQGIITDTTKDRLQELESTRKDLQEKLIFERMQEKTVLEKKAIENYLKKAVEQEPEMMIELLVEKVYVYSDDRIEIMLHYVDTPITPKPIEYDKDESPEGESLRGSLIYTTKIFVDNDIFKGMNKKILEPAIISPFSAVFCFLITTRSPCLIPMSIILSPCVCRINKSPPPKIARGSVTLSSICSTASTGCPHAIEPTIGVIATPLGRSFGNISILPSLVRSILPLFS